MNAAEISGLSKNYGKIEALRGINLQIPQGVIYGLLGPNGAGKTTMIKALVGALTPTSGTIRVLGFDPIHDRWELRKLIGYMPQSPALYEDLSARDNILFFGKAQNTPDLEKKTNEILSFTELKGRENDRVYTFSGGMKKKVSLACTLIHQPKILFLDEPTAAVDPQLRVRTWELFRSLASEGLTLFISTHLMDEALKCDFVAILRQGELLAVDNPKKILEQGMTHVKVVINSVTKKLTIGSAPEDLAKALCDFGLSKKVSSLDVQKEDLETVLLSIINKKDVHFARSVATKQSHNY